MKKNLLYLIIAIILVGCKEQETANIDLGMNKPELQMHVMEKSQLAISSPEYANNPDLVWTSRNTTVATVNKTGEVTAIAPGNTEIYAFVTGINAVRAVSKVTVSGNIKSVLKIEEVTNNISVGETLKAKYTYSTQLTDTLAALDIVTSDSIGPKNIKATIDAKTGILKVDALLPGTVRVKLINKADKKISDSIDVVVVASNITTFEFKNIENGIFELNANDSEKLELEILPATSNYRNIYWKSSNTQILAVDQNGTITAKAPSGSAKISATTPSGEVAICEVKIMPVGGDLSFAKDTIIVTTIKGVSQDITLGLNASPTLTVTVESISSYTGTRAKLTFKNNNTAQFKFTESQVGTDSIVAKSIKNGKEISATCIVIIKDISDDLVKCKPTYSGVDHSTKTLFTAKIANFTATNIILNKVELIHVKPMFDKEGKPTTPKITPIETKENLGQTVKAISPLNVDFAHVEFTPIKVVTPREQYQVRYTYSVGMATNTIVRLVSVDNGAAFAPAL